MCSPRTCRSCWGCNSSWASLPPWSPSPTTLFSVFANVTLGLAPIGWGLLIDAVGARHAHYLGLDWNQYTIFFTLALITYVLALSLAGKLHEPKAASLENLLTEFLVSTPQRLWSRFWPRD